ncbi:hypothetical protein [Actinomadura xylanilytica]|uniref:hypothetical protein n=1 Tax=Actinomadura xylanilytica TaxID=887459 RepID=UPI00255AF6DB|nr:hypothetical protein [Actinomadura xylanilytica]MDL4774989.1 hypothetical protein [Actinomadura xylanilytica]
MSGDVSGSLVQAGSISGGVHFHLPSRQSASARSRAANDYISLCKKGSIRREFPSQYLAWYLGQIRSYKSASARKAWKLLNDSRFNKH